jgi:hypothetical protein
MIIKIVLIFNADTGTKNMTIALAGIKCPAHKPNCSCKELIRG